MTIVEPCCTAKRQVGDYSRNAGDFHLKQHRCESTSTALVLGANVTEQMRGSGEQLV